MGEGFCNFVIYLNMYSVQSAKICIYFLCRCSTQLNYSVISCVFATESLGLLPPPCTQLSYSRTVLSQHQYLSPRKDWPQKHQAMSWKIFRRSFWPVLSKMVSQIMYPTSDSIHETYVMSISNLCVICHICHIGLHRFFIF